MRRSSRILCFLLATMTPVLAQARGFGGGFHGGGFRGGLGGRPWVGVPRAGLRPGIGPGLRGRLGRFGRGRFGLGGVGFGYGLGTLGDVGLGGFGPDLPYGGGAPYGGAGSDGGAGDRPPVFVPVAVPPPPCPVIIAVNGGLRHAAKTRVVYGSQPACRR